MQTRTVSKAKGMQRELVRKVRQVGLWGTAKHVTAKLAHGARGLVSPTGGAADPFDDKYGTDTTGIIGVGSLDIPEDQMEHSMHYGPIGEDEFMETVNSFSLRHEELSFIDIGSGKGRALLLASFFPFRKIIGVEISEMLHDAAVRNIKIFKDKRQKCTDLVAICEDGSTFEIPNEPLLIFLCNPFDDHVMHLVVSHIEDSLKTHPRKIYIWYVKPCYRSALDGSKLLKIVRDTGRYILYEN